MVFLKVLIQPLLLLRYVTFCSVYIVSEMFKSSFRFYKLPRAASISRLVSYHGKPVLVIRECGKHLT